MIVAVFNERALIQGKFENLSRLEYPAGRLRFIIVDGGSSDGSREMALAWTSHDERFLVLATAQPGKACQLNLGLRHARAPWIVVTDVDARMRAETLQALMSVSAREPRARSHRLPGDSRQRARGRADVLAAAELAAITRVVPWLGVDSDGAVCLTDLTEILNRRPREPRTPAPVDNPTGRDRCARERKNPRGDSANRN